MAICSFDKEEVSQLVGGSCFIKFLYIERTNGLQLEKH